MNDTWGNEDIYADLAIEPARITITTEKPSYDDTPFVF